GSRHVGRGGRGAADPARRHQWFCIAQHEPATRRGKERPMTLGRRGYTLLEMMVVMTILATLVLILSQALPFLKQRSRDTARIAAIANLRRVIELYRQDNGFYPGGYGAPTVNFTENDAFATAYGGAGITSTYIPNVVPTYYDALPADPFP